MLKWALIFAVTAVVAGLFGFTGIAAGAAGIAIGRNVWQHANPPLMLRRLHAIVHEDATAPDALSLTL